ncbi:MAG TPA: type II secretion system minor pseudopilin GspI [Caulobacter sp.]|nr:type II secretion system minor pseudopilin GspI [Caulobacter sp.]
MQRPSAEQGFSLIEVLVALAVFSVAALALVDLGGENIRTARAIEARVIAGVVAESRASEAVIDWPPLGETSGEDRAGDRSWRWVRKVSRTDDPEIVRVDVVVTPAPRGRTLAEVTVFRGRR